MKDAQISLKTLAHLQRDGVCFTIAGYQRGFRWTRAEVRELLDDVREFSLAYPAESGAFYCLQPVVVTPASDGSRIVIDGQQRLTTLYLFYCCCSWMLPPSARYNLLPFSIRYPGRTRLQECLEVLSEKEYASAGRFAAETAEFEDDIDCHYLLEAYRCIGDWLHELLKSPSARAGLGSLKQTFDTRVSLIWYELPNLSAADQAALFSMLNTGKIPLTDAELIRALLLQQEAGLAGSAPDPTDTADLRQSIASGWDDMEEALRDDRFWKFLTGGRGGDRAVSSPTRLDFLLRVLALLVNRGVLSDADRQIPEGAPWTVQEEANRERFSFFVFSAWLKLLRGTASEGGGDSAVPQIWDSICKLYRLLRSWYEDTRRYHRIGFLTAASLHPAAELMAELTALDWHAGSASSEDGFDGDLLALIRRELFGTAPASPAAFREWLTGLQYPKDAHRIRQVLLLYNLAVLEAAGTGSRFPFELYRDSRLNWDLEHINAVADPSAGEPDHSIGNLTLLAGFINRAYQNDAFSVKRRVILEQLARGTFLPLCTGKVFRKDFPGAEASPIWSETDKKAYTEDIIRFLCSFLKLEDTGHES